MLDDTVNLWSSQCNLQFSTFLLGLLYLHSSCVCMALLYASLNPTADTHAWWLKIQVIVTLSQACYMTCVHCVRGHVLTYQAIEDMHNLKKVIIFLKIKRLLNSEPTVRLSNKTTQATRIGLTWHVSSVGFAITACLAMFGAYKLLKDCFTVASWCPGLQNWPSEGKKNRWFLVCLLYHNLITIYTTKTKCSSLLQNLMGYLMHVTEMG